EGLGWVVVDGIGVVQNIAESPEIRSAGQGSQTGAMQVRIDEQYAAGDIRQSLAQIPQDGGLSFAGTGAGHGDYSRTTRGAAEENQRRQHGADGIDNLQLRTAPGHRNHAQFADVGKQLRLARPANAPIVLLARAGEDNSHQQPGQDSHGGVEGQIG